MSTNLGAVDEAVPRLFKRKVYSKRVLLAGSGPRENSLDLKWKTEGFEPINLDIDPRNKPDIVASMINMGEIGTFEVIYCCHALEHLYPHEVSKALSEFLRVLSADGTAMIMVPDLEGVPATDDILDIPLCGPITGLHLIYGDATQIEQYPHMAHHSGFVQATLNRAMNAAGFIDVNVRRAAGYNLIGTGKKA